MAIHHVAYATRDVARTVEFYDELMGFPLVHTEIESRTTDAGEHKMTHLFFDAGDGSSIAFFTLENVGESSDFRTDLAESVGVPVWVNHCAFRANEDQQRSVIERMAAAGVEPLMDVDHGWCHSVYFVDPNGIMVELCRDTPGIEPDPTGARSLAAAAHPGAL